MVCLVGFKELHVGITKRKPRMIFEVEKSICIHPSNIQYESKTAKNKKCDSYF